MSMRFLFIITLLFSNYCFACDGFDLDSSGRVDIEGEMVIREGMQIRIFDYNDNSYHSSEVLTIYDFGRSVRFQIQDYELGKARTIQIDNAFINDINNFYGC
jgi:hypothetical protein